jgi:feruloyl esterase
MRIAVAFVVSTLVATPLLAATPCADLGSSALPNVTITSARLVEAGPFTPPGGRGGPPPAIALPAHCRIAAVLTPSADSHVEVEVWLPATTWNGKFQAVGNGGWAGVISYPALAAALQEGYATASTDTGHTGGNALFAIGHPEKFIDYSHRAVHEMTVAAKALITRFYDRGPRLSYWNGCSTGGRQGLMSAQRFPEDFDGIVAGAPANYHSHLHTSDLAASVPALNNPASLLPTATLAVLNEAVIAACDARDGVTDGLLNDPRTCTFDPATLLCRGGDGDTCLTAAQLETVRRVYAPVTTSRGEFIFPGKAFGSETGWGAVSTNASAPISVALGSFQVAYNDADWDWRTFDLDRDVGLVDDRTGFVNAIDPDLRAFKARGGKLLMYHGWNDVAIAPENSINYHASVLDALGPDANAQSDWFRLFMAPGMGHCGGGIGPSQANYMSALERWRESGVAPDRLHATRVTGNRVDMTRPLCPYPQLAEYTGVGSTNDAANFVCRIP